jgi:hypothetical protein
VLRAAVECLRSIVTMNATLLYRTASVLLLLFALGHTVGFLKFKPPTAEGVAVRDAMTSVHFEVRGHDYSYGGFYRGFGLFNTVFLLFAAWLAWHFSNLAARDPRAIGSVGWAFCLLMVATLVLCWAYFNVVATTFSAVLTICLGWAAWQVRGLAGRAAR